MKIIAFCTPEQQEKEHEVSLDLAGDLVMTCSCGHFIKAPMGIAPAQMRTYLDEHKAQNKDRVFLNLAEEKAKTEALQNYMKGLVDSGIASRS